MSNGFIPDDAEFAKLKGKVVVLTGGANGIGAEVVKKLDMAGAKIVFGDNAKDAGERLAQCLTHAIFMPMDVTQYRDHLKLFRLAVDNFGKVDHAIPCAGIIEKGKWFDPDLTIDSDELQQPETEIVIDVNFLGTLYFTRIAAVYLRHNKQDGDDRSIVLIASAAGFRESPGLFTYQCTKHAVMGLLRTLRRVIYPRDGTRINAVCPGVTDTQMTANIIENFRNTGQAINSANDVAKIIVGLLMKTSWNGKAVYVENSNGWEIEDGLIREMPRWLGEEPTERLMKGLKEISTGEAWKVT